MKANQIDKTLRSAVRSAANKLIRRGRTATSKRVREVYNIKASDLKNYTKVKKATNSNPTAAIIISGRPIPLILFSAKQNKRGVSVRVKKTTGRKIIQSSFIATMPSGKIQVWMRKGAKRLPIKQLLSVSPPKMYEKEGEKVFKELISKEAGKTVQHEIDYYANKG